MTVLRKVWSGRSDELAAEIVLERDPDASGAPAIREDEGWGAFSLWVRGRNLTAHWERDGGFRDAVRWDLGSLLEWLAGRWDPLLHEQRLPLPVRAWTLAEAYADADEPPSGLGAAEQEAWDEARYATWERHCLLAARDGGPMPDVAWHRQGDMMQVSWSGEDAAGTGVRYAEAAGFAVVPAEVAGRVLFEVLAGATEALCEAQPGSRRWQALRAEVGGIGAGAGEVAKRRQAWLLGGEAGVARWAAAVARLPAKQRRGIDWGLARLRPAGAHVQLLPEPALLFGTLSPRLSDEDVVRILAEWAEARRAGPAGARVLELGATAGFDPRPAAQAYALAVELREALGLAGEPIADLDGLLEGLGVAVKSVELSDRATPAVALASPQTRPTVLVNSRSPKAAREATRRMLLAHELAHLLHDRDRSSRVALVDGDWAPLWVEQRARAFAVMLLLPDEGVRRWVAEGGADPATPDGLRGLADHFGVSWTAAARHLANLGWIPGGVDAADDLVEQLAARA